MNFSRNAERTPSLAVPLQNEMATMVRNLPQGDIRGMPYPAETQRQALYQRLEKQIRSFKVVGPTLLKSTGDNSGITYIDDPGSVGLVEQVKASLAWKEADREVHPNIKRKSRRDRIKHTLSASALTGLLPVGFYESVYEGNIATGGLVAALGTIGLLANYVRHDRADESAEKKIVDAINTMDGTFISGALSVAYEDAPGDTGTGIHQEEAVYLKKILPHGYVWLIEDGSVIVNCQVNRMVESMLKADTDPESLWHEHIHDAVHAFAQIDNDVKSIIEDHDRYDKRARLTGIENQDEAESLNKRREDARRSIEQQFILTVRGVYPRWREQKIQEDIERMKIDMFEGLNGAIEGHGHFGTLLAFSNFVFDISLSLKADENGRGSSLTQSMHEYVQSMAQLMDSDTQTKQFFNGFTIKFGEDVQLPAWDEFENKYIINAGIDT